MQAKGLQGGVVDIDSNIILWRTFLQAFEDRMHRLQQVHRDAGDVGNSEEQSLPASFFGQCRARQVGIKAESEQLYGIAEKANVILGECGNPGACETERAQ